MFSFNACSVMLNYNTSHSTFTKTNSTLAVFFLLPIRYYSNNKNSTSLLILLLSVLLFIWEFIESSHFPVFVSILCTVEVRHSHGGAEDQFVTPWSISVAMIFDFVICVCDEWDICEENDPTYTPVSSSIYFRLQERNERLFYKLLLDHAEELLPVVYTPTVGEACQKYGSIFVHPQDLYLSLNEKKCLLITIDVGTNNEKLLNDELYFGLRHKRATGQEYAELLHEFMNAVKQNYGERILVQFEDFANHNAFDLLERYRSTHLVFNDDIQGTAQVVLAGLVAALKLVGGDLTDHRFLFLGAGEAGTGIAELIAFETSKRTNVPLDEVRKNIWLVDSKGLIVSSRKESLQHFKKPWAHEHEPVKELVNVVKQIKPTVLIGTSGQGRTFTKDVVEAMASINEVIRQSTISYLLCILMSTEANLSIICNACRNLLFFLFPTRHHSRNALLKRLKLGASNDYYHFFFSRFLSTCISIWDVPFLLVGAHLPQLNMMEKCINAYIFPGFGLGLIMSGTIRVHDDLLLAASEALASQVTQEDYDKGLIYPPFSNIRKKISAHIAANVAAKAYELGEPEFSLNSLATRLPQPKDLVKFAESSVYSPVYRGYR
ncbi:NADP-dependent malic enzyme, chloroplastic [Glycine soja]